MNNSKRMNMGSSLNGNAAICNSMECSVHFLKGPWLSYSTKSTPQWEHVQPSYILAISLQTIAQVNNNCYLVFLSNYVTTKRKPVSIDFVVIFIFCKIDEVFIGQHTAFRIEMLALRTHTKWHKYRKFRPALLGRSCV